MKRQAGTQFRVFKSTRGAIPVLPQASLHEKRDGVYRTHRKMNYYLVAVSIQSVRTGKVLRREEWSIAGRSASSALTYAVKAAAAMGHVDVDGEICKAFVVGTVPMPA